jgi:hypothetical protein
MEVISKEFEIVMCTSLAKAGDQYGMTGMFEAWALPKANWDKLKLRIRPGGWCGDDVISEKDLVELGGFKIEAKPAVIVSDFDDLDDEEKEFLEEGEGFESPADEEGDDEKEEPHV